MNDNTLKSGNLLKHGEYRIERTLGQGGFGITYEAEQVSLGRKVAVKEFFMKDYCDREDGSSHVTLSTSSSSRELVERFRTKFIREARMIAGLDHDHIVKIIDVFEENGTAYYVMEYLGGGCLGDGVKAGKAMSESEALNYICQIADALSYLHSQNILHFDVKPSNVLLGKNDRVKLIDFGISKHYDESGVQTSSTPVGISKGFAPLEQYKQGSDINSFTPATDIYALGATLYALLAGANPPEASDVNDDGLPFIAGISPNILNAIEKAMQPRRKDRPQSVGEFLALLDDVAVKVDDEETTVPVPSCKHEWVDLGLSVKWASCNVGATKPDEYGDYFAWGETSPKSNYRSSTLKYCTDNSGDSFSKYVVNSKYGPVDNKTKLELGDDAARANWGGSWRMPTINEFQELIDKCKWTWTKMNGKNGYKVTSKSNGNSIFLPAAGWCLGTSLDNNGYSGCYWSSSLYESSSNDARYLFFYPGRHYRDYNLRCGGYSVRPVCP